MNNVQLYTTSIIDGKPIEKYYGIVTANQVAGTGFFTDLTASLSDIFGGYSGVYRESMNELYREVTERLKDEAAERGANAIVGVRIDYDNISSKGMSMFMVSMQGTAVKIADIDAGVSETNDEISWATLNLAYHKRKINRRLDLDQPISDEEWEFILKNRIDGLSPSLFRYYQKCIDAPLESENTLLEPHRPDWATSGISYFKKYLSTLDYKDSIKYAYKNIDDFKDLIIKNKLFSASNILHLAKETNLDSALSVLCVEKSSYNVQDLAEMQELSEYLQNLPDVGKIEETKGGLFSSGGMKFMCSCGTKNEISSEYCSECGKNIKGITRNQEQAISNYVDLVETLTEILR